MVRLIIFMATGGLTGLVFGFAFFLIPDALWGLVIGAGFGAAIAAFLNAHPEARRLR